MTTHHTDGDLRSIWQSQLTPRVDLTPEQLRERARKFQSRIRWRNVREYVASAFVVVAVGFSLSHWQTLLPRLGFIMLALWSLYWAYCMRRFGSSATPPEESHAQSHLYFHRLQLERQRDLARAWPWTLVPSIPGFLLVVIGMQLESHPGKSWEWPIATVGIYSLFLIAIAIQNKWLADHWQGEIEALDTYGNAK